MRGIGDADHATRRQLATQRAQARPLPRQARAQPVVGVVQPAAETAADALERIQSRLLTAHAERGQPRSEEHTSELQSLMRRSYAVFCLKKKNTNIGTSSQQDDRSTPSDCRSI